jgi:ABC-2 type transport system permease protein
MSLRQAVSYIWLAQTLIMFQLQSIDSEILTKITNGDVGTELCRPLDLYFHWYARVAAGRLGGGWWRGFITITVGLLMPAGYRLMPPATVPGFLLFVISTVSALMLCTSFGMLMTSIRLGVTCGEGPVNMLMTVSSVLSGVYLPLQLWPDFLQKFLLVQPFAGYLDIPVRLYSGAMTPQQALPALLLQLVWTALFIAVGRLVMNRKLRNLIVQGG